MRIAICWHSISGYMAACWRALAKRPGVDLLVVTQRPDAAGVAPFDPAIVAGVSLELVAPSALGRPDGIRAIVAAHRPDVIVLNGWFIPAVTALAFAPELAGAKRIIAIDRGSAGHPRDLFNRLRHRRLLDRMHLIMVAGERSLQLARRLGFSDSRIRRGTYAVDFDHFAPTYAQRLARAGGWPRSFLFTGRYAPEKGIDTLMKAYTAYRARVRDPWPLVCCGRGPLGSMVAGTPGVQDRGFVQPADQPALLREQGVSVLVSTFEPWGAVVAEAAASGLPLICSTEVGAAVELLQPYYNGVVCAPGDIEGVARALAWMHEHAAELPEMGRRSRELAAGASASNWAVRWHEACTDAATLPDR